MAIRTKSPLATVQILSPNRNAPRNKPIRRLTPHHVAGNLTVEAVANLDRVKNYNATSGMSPSYAIGTDGRMCCIVEETNRPWTSSSATNDHQAITFEIANNGGAPDWRISDAALSKWVEAAAEIAAFYGFKKVNYKEKPTNVTPANVESWIATWETADAMTITLHQWFTATACPGPYFVAMLPQLVTEINNKLSKTDVVPDPKPIDEIANEVIQGRWGNGQEWIDKLTAAGYDAAIVQKKVDELLGKNAGETGSGGSFQPYEVTITASALNIRKGPAVTYGIAKTLMNDKNVYTIVEEKTGRSSTTDTTATGKWGRLKSGIGWVLLAFTKKK